MLAETTITKYCTLYSLSNRNAVGGSLTYKSQQSWFLLGLWTGSFSKGPHLVIPMGVYKSTSLGRRAS